MFNFKQMKKMGPLGQIMDMLPGQMGQAARAHVEGRFEWQQTFEALLGEVYPKALRAAEARMERGRSGWNGPSILFNRDPIRQASR